MQTSFIFALGRNAHGKRTPEANSYAAAQTRCTNPKHISYPLYGGRGIEFRFKSFAEFYAELGEKPKPKELYTLDRIDNAGHYEPGNVRWATWAQQAANRRPHRIYRRRTARLIAMQWLRKAGLSDRKIGAVFGVSKEAVRTFLLYRQQAVGNGSSKRDF